MTARKRNWIVAVGLVAVLLAVGLAIAASVLAARVEPYARQAAIRYLSERFASDVELQSLSIRLPETSLFHLVLTRGRGISARIEGQGLSLRLKDRPGSVPLFAIKKFRCDVDLQSLLHPPVTVTEIWVTGMEIQVPPRAERTPASRPALPPASRPAFVPAPPPDAAGAEPAGQQSESNPTVTIRKVSIQHAVLVLNPRDSRKVPLRFEIQNLQLDSVGAGAPMKYDASLTNAKPPGKVHTTGTFGPWLAGEPADTPITGDYEFTKADLGVFAGIAGTLRSTGSFEGKLSALTARGQASVPDFRLRKRGSPVPLSVRFTVLVDGSNGNTTLQPVTATLGSTKFSTSGGIIRHEANQPRAISLDVSMPDGNLRDVLRLAMKGDPFMEGRLALSTKIDIPPLTEKVREKLEMDGHFQVSDARFLHSTIQDQIDGLSNRARGQPRNPASDQVVSNMSGAFHLEDAAIRFQDLSFGIPGADIDLAGDYDLDSDALAFAGTLKLQAKVSQLVTGWKRLILKPADRLFEKEGAGTFLRIRVDGTYKAPKFSVNVAGRELAVPLPKR
jgi:hypothetical protein